MIYIIAIIVMLPFAVLSELLKSTDSKKGRGGVMSGPGSSTKRRK